MSANDIQHGGSHYQGDYQHWDFVLDAGLGYLDGNATKYLTRWERKGTPQLDLEKAGHYLDKAMERGIKPRYSGVTSERAADRFVAAQGLGVDEEAALRLIVRGEYQQARIVATALLGHYLGREQLS